VFNKLTKSNITKIVDLQLKDLAEKLAKRKITVTLSDDAKKKLAEEGYDAEFGARPLRRMIQREIQDALALKLLEGTYKDGDTIRVGVDKNEQFEFEKA
jgi:ATP-dependent Clp protease ATP-binding subunit ClpB